MTTATQFTREQLAAAVVEYLTCEIVDGHIHYDADLRNIAQLVFQHAYGDNPHTWPDDWQEQWDAVEQTLKRQRVTITVSLTAEDGDHDNP